MHAAAVHLLAAANAVEHVGKAIAPYPYPDRACEGDFAAAAQINAMETEQNAAEGRSADAT